MKRTLAFLLILALLLSLTACSSADTPQQTTAEAPDASDIVPFADEEYQYVAKRSNTAQRIAGDNSVAAGNHRFWQFIPRTDTDDRSPRIVSSRYSGFFENHPYIVEDHHFLSALAPIPRESDCLWFIESVHIPGTSGHEYHAPHKVVRINAMGDVVASADITQLIGERDLSRSVGAALPDGRYFICVEDLVCLFDGEGKLLMEITADRSTGSPEATLTASGTVALLLDVNGARQLYLLNETTQRLEALGKVNEQNADTHLAAGDAFFDLYLFDKDLCGYSLSTGEKTKILTFHHLDIVAPNVVCVFPTGKSDTGAPRFGCYEIRDGQASPLLLEHRVRMPEKITLRIGTTSDAVTLAGAVNLFNYENPKYQIEVVTYATDADPTGLANFSSALSAGDIPDLLDLKYMPWYNLVRQKLLRDLTPFIEADPELSTDSFLPNILDLLTHEDGSIYALTNQFNIHTIHTLRSQAGDIPDNWTWTDALAVMDANPRILSLLRNNSPDYLTLILSFSMGQFIDLNTLTASFDSPEFLALLELAYRSVNVELPKNIGPYASFSAGNYLMFESSALIRPVFFFEEFRARFGDDLQTPGFPGTGSLVYFYNKYAMTTRCMFPDGAWDFIRSTILSTNDNDPTLGELPVLEKEYEARLDYWRNHYIRQSSSYSYLPTEEDFAIYDTIIRSAKVEEGVTSTLYPFIREVIPEYLNGLLSAEETAGIIQSRVTQALSEMR